MVRGIVTGTIHATRIVLLESAGVAGDIFCDCIFMERGARFLGASNAELLPCAAASLPDAVL